jgi:hypothetical protein
MIIAGGATPVNARPCGKAAKHDAGEQHLSLDRIGIALIPKAWGDLQQLQDRAGLAKSDLVNRAITLYEYIEAHVVAAALREAGGP